MDNTKLMLALTRYGNPQLPSLVLLHGFLGSKNDWQDIVHQLSTHFYCLCFDLPGHGDSAHIALPTPGFTACAELVIASLEAEDIESFHLHGYSLGGRIALHVADILATSAPERLLSLSLESCHPGLKQAEQRQQRQNNDEQWAERIITLEIEAFLFLWYQQAVFAELSDTERLSLVQTRRNNKPLSLYNCYRATSLALQENLWALPSRLKVPCHYYLGERDEKFLALADNWQQEAPINNHVIVGTGHNVHLGAPQFFAQALIANMLGQA